VGGGYGVRYEEKTNGLRPANWLINRNTVIADGGGGGELRSIRKDARGRK